MFTVAATLSHKEDAERLVLDLCGRGYSRSSIRVWQDIPASPPPVRYEDYLTKAFVDSQRNIAASNAIPRTVYFVFLYFAMPGGFKRAEAKVAVRKYFGSWFSLADMEDVKRAPESATPRWEHEMDYALQDMRFMGFINSINRRWVFEDRDLAKTCEVVFDAARKSNSKAAMMSNNKQWCQMDRKEMIKCFREACGWQS